MKHNEGQSPATEGLVKPSARHTALPEFPPLNWIHLIYDHSDDTSDLEHDFEAAPPHHRPASQRPAFSAE